MEKDADGKPESLAPIAESGENCWETQGHTLGGSAQEERRAKSSREQQSKLIQS